MHNIIIIYHNMMSIFTIAHTSHTHGITNHIYNCVYFVHTLSVDEHIDNMTTNPSPCRRVTDRKARISCETPPTTILRFHPPLHWADLRQNRHVMRPISRLNQSNKTKNLGSEPLGNSLKNPHGQKPVWDHQRWHSKGYPSKIPSQETILSFTFNDHIRQVKPGNQRCWPPGRGTVDGGWWLCRDKAMRSKHVKTRIYSGFEFLHQNSQDFYGCSSPLKDKQYF